MSLGMMFCQNEAAYLISDGGCWDAEGVCTCIGSKVATFPELNAAIIALGYNPNPLRFWARLSSVNRRGNGDRDRHIKGYHPLAVVLGYVGGGRSPEPTYPRTTLPPATVLSFGF